MRRLMMTVVATAAIALAGAGAWTAQAQTSRGAALFHAQQQNFSPIEKAACGPRRGEYCGPYHHRVCNPYHCWCARC